MCETRWKNSGEVQTDEGHTFYYSGEDDRHANWVGFLFHKGIQSAVLSCQPISSWIITIRLRAKPLNITIIQVYAPTVGPCTGLKSRPRPGPQTWFEAQARSSCADPARARPANWIMRPGPARKNYVQARPGPQNNFTFEARPEPAGRAIGPTT